MDLDLLPQELRRSVRVDANGEVAWPLDSARDAIEALADAGVVVLGLGLRTYDEDGAITEVAWTVFEPASSSSSVQDARLAALDALGRPDLPGDWVLATVAG